ncbi:MAG: hypothetical protein KJ072_11310 [Verrucomicrobia bacterium]|jgi:hypothetical protein|nr:hypothetical protein [Verrucomicrobiota bacterium]
MISGGDFAVFLVAVLIVVSFFLIMRQFMRRAEKETDLEPPGHSEP